MTYMLYKKELVGVILEKYGYVIIRYKDGGLDLVPNYMLISCE